MRADTKAVAARGTAGLPRVAARRKPRPARAAGPLLAGLLLIAFMVFFVLPVIWLLLAATKTDTQLVQ